MSPLVSVLMSVYNGEKYLAEAIESILGQTFTDFEFLIVDDGSTDSTGKMLAEYAEKDARIQIICNDANRGLAFSLNKGIRLARSTYLARMDADDISLPHRLKTQFDFMKAHPEIDICGSWMERFGKETGVVSLPEGDEEIRTHLFFSCSMAHPTVMIRHDLLAKRDLFFDEKLSCAVDYDLWARAIDNAKFHNIQEVLVRYRMHGKQIGSARKKTQEENSRKIIGRLLEKSGISFAPEEFEIHYSLDHGYVSPQTVFGLESVIAWLNKLKNSPEANARHPLLRQHLSARVNIIGEYHQLLGGNQPVFASFCENALRDTNIPVWQRLRFLIRYLFRKMFMAGS